MRFEAGMWCTVSSRKACDRQINFAFKQTNKITTQHLSGCLQFFLKKMQINKCWWWCGKVGTTMQAWHRCKVVQLILNIFNNVIPRYAAKRVKNQHLNSMPMFPAVWFTIVKRWKQPKCLLTDTQINKMQYIYTIRYLYIKEWNSDVLQHSRSLKNVQLNKTVQKDKYCMPYLLYF